MKRKKLEPGAFARVFGTTPRNIVIECFLEMRGLDYSIGDIAREIELNRMTAYKAIRKLEQEGYLAKTRKVSGSQLYKLNENNPEVKILIKTFDAIINAAARGYEMQKPEAMTIRN